MTARRHAVLSLQCRTIQVCKLNACKDRSGSSGCKDFRAVTIPASNFENPRRTYTIIPLPKP